MDEKIKLYDCILTDDGVVKCNIDVKNFNKMLEKKINPSQVSLTRKQDEIKTEVPAKSDSDVPAKSDSDASAKSKSCGCPPSET